MSLILAILVGAGFSIAEGSSTLYRFNESVVLIDDQGEDVEIPAGNYPGKYGIKWDNQNRERVHFLRIQFEEETLDFPFVEKYDEISDKDKAKFSDQGHLFQRSLARSFKNFYSKSFTPKFRMNCYERRKVKNKKVTLKGSTLAKVYPSMQSHRLTISLKDMQSGKAIMTAERTWGENLTTVGHDRTCHLDSTFKGWWLKRFVPEISEIDEECPRCTSKYVDDRLPPGENPLFKVENR